MLNESATLSLVLAATFTSPARSVIDQVRSSPPARQVAEAPGT